MSGLIWHDQELVAIVETTARKSLRKGAQAVARAAKARCPVGIETRGTAKKGSSAGKFWTERTPGSLKKSIRARSSKKKLSAQAIAGNKQVWYARFVEFGTSKTLAQPFMRNALESTFPEVMEGFRDKLP